MSYILYALYSPCLTFSMSYTLHVLHSPCLTLSMSYILHVLYSPCLIFSMSYTLHVLQSPCLILFRSTFPFSSSSIKNLCIMFPAQLLSQTLQNLPSHKRTPRSSSGVVKLAISDPQGVSEAFQGFYDR